MPDTTAIQKRLKDLGFDPGPLDGVRGRRTAEAIRRFQLARGLAVNGLVGAATAAQLFAGSAAVGTGSEQDLPWYEEARRLQGTRERSGPASNGIILDWAKTLDIAYAEDDIPWCGLFVAHCVGATLPGEPLPAHPLGARNWRAFGRACEPTKGCVLVFWRTHRTRSPNGHVGFYAGEDDHAFHVLGGNQSNEVNVARIAKTRLLAARFPATVPHGAPVVVRLTPTTSAFDTAEA